MEKHMECPWCNKSVNPKAIVFKAQYGSVKEWTCPECKGMLSAYLNEKGSVTERVQGLLN